MLSAMAALLCGTLCASAATPPDIVFYGRSASASIRYVQWDGSVWSASGAGSNVTAAPDWVIGAGCPTRAESVVVTIDAARVARVFHHIGIYCCSTTLLTSSAGTVGRTADVVYEQASSEALVAYWNGAASNVGWRTSSLGTLSSASTLTLPATNPVSFLRLVPVPGTDQILLLAINDNHALYACMWSGSAWGTVTTISTDTSTCDAECFAAAFERNSGEGLLVYSPASTSNLVYRTLIGGVWSSEQSGPSVGNTYDWVRLSSRPGSNTLLLGLQDHNKSVQVAFWGGSSFGSLTSCTSDTGSDTSRRFDVSYEPGGVNALVVYGRSGQNAPGYRVWNGTAWSVESSGPTATDTPVFITLAKDSGSDIHVLWSNGLADLNVAKWNGTTMGSATLIDANIAGTTTTEPFSMIIPTSDAVPKPRIVRWREAAAQ